LASYQIEMLGVSGLISASADGAATATAPPGEAPESGGAGSAAGGPESGAAVGGYGEEDKAEAERNSGGNRWPRQETLALLKIRSDMDVVFRDSSLKGPLWEEVSRYNLKNPNESFIFLLLLLHYLVDGIFVHIFLCSIFGL